MIIHKHMTVIAMIFTQLVYAGMYLLSKAAISSGIKPSVFITYRQALATLALAPFAYFLDRNESTPLKFYVFCKIILVSLVGVTLSLNLNYIALNYISATFSTAANNTIPSLVFIIAVFSRIEKVEIREKQGWAKIFGTILGLSGAMIFTFYKGPHLYSGHANNLIAKDYTKQEWIKGSILLLGSMITWALWLVMQVSILTEYPAKLRLMTLQNGISCIATAIYGAIVEHSIQSWKLRWNVNLFSIVYSGIFVSGINFTVQAWVLEKKGPVYTAIFNPLELVFTAVLSAVFFHESFYWGSVLGAATMVIGLYAFLWGKYKEAHRTAQLNLVPSQEEIRLESMHSYGPVQGGLFYSPTEIHLYDSS